MNSATQATEPVVRVVPSPLLSVAKRGGGIREKLSAVQWAVLIHLVLITILLLIKTVPAGQPDEYLVVDTAGTPWPTTGCPGPDQPDRPRIATPSTARPSSAIPKPEVAALPKLEITSVTSQISQPLNSTTYDALRRGDGQLETSMFAPSPLSPSSDLYSLPPPISSLLAVPSMLFFSPLANPGPIAIPGFSSYWIRRR